MYRYTTGLDYFCAMVTSLEVEDFLLTGISLVDVRSPGEYRQGHLPGATNIPLFSDEERASVGTAYTKESAEEAWRLGYRYVLPKLEDFIHAAEALAPERKLGVYCWRGGLRSATFADHLSLNGFREVITIRGGYKAYRNLVLRFFDTPLRLEIIGGYTGSGKTSIIPYLCRKGHQAVDLEALANHKGSAFGSMGRQPTVEQFENNLFETFRHLDLTRPVWLEDESRNIGGVTLPPGLYRQMLDSEVFFLDIPRSERITRLVEEYKNQEISLLADPIARISRRMGEQNAGEALQRLKELNWREAANLILNYYDKSYLKGLRLHRSDKIITLAAEDTDPVKNGARILLWLEEHRKQESG